MRLRHLINALPLIAIALLLALVHSKVFPTRTNPSEESDRPKVVHVPENRQLPQSEEWTVVKVADGDTITVRRGTRKERIRFCGVDAPEVSRGSSPGQPLGKESKVNLQRLIDEAGGKVQIVVVGNDRYDRKVAEVFTVLGNGIEKFLQEEQTLAGLSLAYRDYLSDCPNANSILKAEEIAKENRAGVWSDSNTVPPWEYRRQQRHKRS